jgi:hypothetical protein
MRGTNDMIERAVRYSCENNTAVYILCHRNREVDRIMGIAIKEECWKYKSPPLVYFLSTSGQVETQIHGRDINSDNLFVDNYVHEDLWNGKTHFMRELRYHIVIGDARKDTTNE